MSTSSFGHEEHRGGYFIDSESSQEMARLMEQDRVLTQGMGGLLAECQDVSEIQAVLDIACGPGGWLLDLAMAYPGMKEAFGVDISRQMIIYATALAQTQGMNHLHFLEMDVTKRLLFPDASFDLVNARYLVGFMPTSGWPAFFQECQRILRPGGVLRITEPELGDSTTTSLALEQMCSWLMEAVWKAGHSFSPGVRNLGMVVAIPTLFRQTGYEYQPQNYRSHWIDTSTDSKSHRVFYEDFYKLSQPFLVAMGVATQEEIDPVYAQLLEDIQCEDFRAVRDVHTFWGKKPG